MSTRAEHLAGIDAAGIVAQDRQGIALEQALDGLFAALLRERISHGDLKGYNVFWDNGRWSLIDLDAMRQHHSDRSFARAYERDRARFLRNWPADSRLFKLLDQRLPQVPGTCPERG